MPAVFVHGNPETPAVWEPLIARLERDDVLNLQLPGFGVPAPAGFAATKEEYVGWLVAELEAIGTPVDLVGHDWGGGFVLRVACIRPDLLATWVSDVAGLFDPDYVWHDFAQLWQTPGDGEQWIRDTISAPRQDRVDLLHSVGVTGEAADAFADAFDEEMGRCILALYRSAAQPALIEWGRDAEAASARPGLVLAPTEDPFTGGPDLARRVAERMGARHQPLDGLGHWWMLADPARGARVLEEFWDAVRQPPATRPRNQLGLLMEWATFQAGAGAAVVIAHGTTPAGTARATVFAMNPLYRADPEREWSIVGLAAYWGDQ